MSGCLVGGPGKDQARRTNGGELLYAVVIDSAMAVKARAKSACSPAGCLPLLDDSSPGTCRSLTKLHKLSMLKVLVEIFEVVYSICRMHRPRATR